MFAYCENSPICQIDESGEESYWSLAKKGQIEWSRAHKLVQEDIQKNYFGVEIEVYVDRGKKNGGRTDIYLNGYVWEIKSMGSADLALSQALSYVSWPCSRTKSNIKGLGVAGAFEGTIIDNVNGTNYLITYTTPIEGVIIYYVEELPQMTQEDFLSSYVYACSIHACSSFCAAGVTTGYFSTATVSAGLDCSIGNDFFPWIAYAQ